MNYCKKCYILCEDNPCPRCGNKFVRPPEPEDYVFLTEKDYPWSEVLESALKEEGIPVAVNEAITGAWLTVQLGSRFECHRLFVPYKDWDKANSIMEAIFDEANFSEDFEWEEEEV